MESSNFVRDLLYDGTLHPLIKPDMVFGNYFFKWDDKSLGLYSNEIIKFKNFIRNTIPSLESMMNIIDTSSSSLSTKSDPVKKAIFDKAHFSISNKFNSYIIFILNVDNKGSTTFFREERILINDELYYKMKNHYGSKEMMLLNKLKDFDNIVSVKWKLGDLLFNRTGYKQINNK
ncbi:MAG: hypothetical protein M3Z01_01075 [Thermoproteota archaeon]|nr:hypothetical protein [Thermoproteota archaeon]